MIIVLKADVEADSPEVRRLIELAESFPEVRTQLHRIQGATRSVTEVYLLGHTGVIPTAPFEEFACVERVVRVTEKFRAIGRHGGGLDASGFPSSRPGPAPTSPAPAPTTSRATGPPACPTSSSWRASTASASWPWR
jgi:hypothetical protein